MTQKNRAKRNNWVAPCAYCNNTGWVCENHFWREAHTCECGGAGKPCRCNKANPPWDLNPNNTLTRKGGRGGMNRKIEQALELLARKIDKINKTDNFPNNTLDEIRELLTRKGED